jgi:hypothetical protein
MPVLKNIVVVCCLVAVTTVAAAQKPNSGKPVTTVKNKLPKLKITLGGKSDSVIVAVDEAISLISLPLTITDDKKINYSIVTYQCLYRRKGVTEDEESGKVSPISSVVAGSFKTTPLTEIWKKTITEQLKPGEEIFFFDVVVKDAQGKLMFAPNLKLMVK